MKYEVKLNSTAAVDAVIEVEAESSAEAGEKAVDEAQRGNVIWRYNGCEDENIEIETVSQQ